MFNKKSGFTIVELLIVIVVIGILAAITIVAYGNVRSNAVKSTLKSDLSQAQTQLEIYRTDNNGYPTNGSDVNGGRGITASPNTTIAYTRTSNGYCLTATTTLNDSSFYYQSSDGIIAEGACSSIPAGYEAAPVISGGNSTVGGYSGIQPANCPSTGGAWVKVPGNTLYSIPNGFCVQQYPAANVSSIATSQPNVARWSGINTGAAQSAAATAATNAHMLTENEWMTIAANAAMQTSNWSGAAIGNGTLPKGSSTSTRGTLFVTLSNGSQVYFDTGSGSYYASNEFTCYTGPNANACGLAGQYHPSPSNALYSDQLATFTSFGSLPVTSSYYYGDPRYANPSLGSYINSSRTAGLGYLRSTYASGATTVYNFTRGPWTGVNSSGLFTLYLYTDQTYAHATYGFRAAVQ